MAALYMPNSLHSREKKEKKREKISLLRIQMAALYQPVSLDSKEKSKEEKNEEKTREKKRENPPPPDTNGCSVSARLIRGENLCGSDQGRLRGDCKRDKKLTFSLKIKIQILMQIPIQMQMHWQIQIQLKMLCIYPFQRQA